ncbi:MAG: sulfurtransferase [Chloroflexi bacterium AL-W]|nr:sulfurtransferase [Chloroflexi bacterium AL-N1]NOK65420.1 sulfurtransferase [Chloroflexi bacterium AL-N10]NOK72314.1 sulfurtransferase [Chloroflexi bacterium AL-N5]NOK79599.1 sulfurtransferase [Chloroflexi bacterium AL-W]NOK87515.1 sulfurtransferase [Chloroflexi bacterium AL-N15]
MTPQQVKTKLDQNSSVRLIDVREAQEYAIAQIDGAELLPMSQAQQWLTTLPHDQEIIFFCHSGVRSEHVASYVAHQLGYINIANMLGGIDAWSLDIDPDVPRY